MIFLMIIYMTYKFEASTKPLFWPDPCLTIFVGVLPCFATRRGRGYVYVGATCLLHDMPCTAWLD